MPRKRWVAAATLAAAGFAAPAASAETIYGLTDGNALVTFDSASPGTTSDRLDVARPSGVTSIEGIDIRPATLQLYALGSNSDGSSGQLFIIDTVTGTSTPVGSPFALSGEDFDIDFNPNVDRLRIVSDEQQNLRVNPNNGVATTDTPLTGAGASDVTGAAYTNNAPLPGSTTELLDIDTALDDLLEQGDATPPGPNGGVLTKRGDLGADLVGDVGFDVSTASGANGALGANTGYVVGRTGDTNDRFYTVDLASGALGNGTEVGGTGADKVKDIAVAAPVPQLAVVYTNPIGGAQTLVTVRADRPSDASAAVTITGLRSDEDIVGIDRRANNGLVYAVTEDERVYTLNLSNGQATQVGTTQFTPALAGAFFGVDFNPTTAIDAIRLVTNADENARINSNTGARVDPPDGPINNPEGDEVVTAAAYTNPVANATNTQLFDLDTGRDVLALQEPPNDGTLTTIGPLGQNFAPSNGYDIVARFNQGFAALQTEGTLFPNEPILFTVNSFTPPAPPMDDRRTAAIGPLGGEPMGASIAGMTIVRDDILPAAPTPTSTPSPTPTSTIPTPTPTATPPYNVKRKPRLTARVKPKRDKKKPFVFRVQGRLILPDGVSRSQGCKGTVRVTGRKGKKVVSRRRTGLKSTCKYKVRAKLRKNAGRRGRVKFKAQFLGNDRLFGDEAPTVSARYGKNKKRGRGRN